MLNPFQKSNLKIARPFEKTSGKNDPQNKPNIIACFEAVIGIEQKLRRSGRATTALCPYHGENNPSFAMYEDTNTFYCFTCGATGDSYNFLMEQLNCDFLAAKEYAEDNGLFDSI